MVNRKNPFINKRPLALGFLLVFFTANFAHSETSKEVVLNQKIVAELAMSQGYKTQEVNLQYQTLRLSLIQSQAVYDWSLGAETGYQMDNSLSLLSTGTTPLNNKYQQYKTSLTATKPLSTGTLLGIEVNRLSQQSNIDPVFNNPPPDRQTLDSAGLTLEQSLWGNFFGEADRAVLNAADHTYHSQNILRANNLEDVVLESIRQFWKSYSAQENFKEAMASRDRYRKLVDVVKRKTSLGYSNPGDLPQAQAELESREQAVKAASVAYLNNIDTLLTLLKLDPNTEVKFEIGTGLPNVPKLAEKSVQDLRAIRSQKLKVDAANESLVASKSKSFPSLNLVAKAYTTGWGEDSQNSYSGMIATDRPKYYIGLKLAYKFGSDLPNEDLINKKINKDLEQSRLNLQTLQTTNLQIQSERNVHETYALALGAEKQKNFREKAVLELNRSYSQGRTDISILINSMNNFVSAELAYIKAIGDYHIALNEWAAARDELIPDDPSLEAVY